MKNYGLYEILSNKHIAADVFDMTVLCPDVAEACTAGQFVSVFLDKGEHLLPRPISICEADSENGTVRLVYRIVGQGTAYIGQKTAGEKIKLLAPLGNGYDLSVIKESGAIAVIGGGIGTPPLLELSKRIKQNNRDCSVYAFLGFRTEPFLTEDFIKYCDKVHISTDDGSVGFCGNAVDDAIRSGIKFDTAFACGPNVMLKAAARWVYETETALFVSMEERMACSIGACVGCVAKVWQDGDFVYKRVCKDGPVFNAREVVWQ